MRSVLTVAEAARRAGRNPETVRRWIREGKLRASKVGTQHVIEEADLEHMLEKPKDEMVPVPAEWRRTFWGAPGSGNALLVNEWLPAIVGRIVHIANPVRIVVFGARARSDARYDDDYELLVVLDDVPDRDAARVELRRSFADIPVSAEILVASAADLAADPTGSSRRALAEGRTVYARDAIPAGSILQRLIETGRATPALNPDTSVLPARWPPKGGITATDALLAERREDLR
jgi:excisionase family DNA binding protein